MAETQGIENQNPKPRRTIDIPLDAAPVAIGTDADEHLVRSAHDLTTDVDPAWAGEYELLIGTVRIGVGPDAKVYRGREYAEPVVREVNGRTVKEPPKLLKGGAKLRLGAFDAFRFSQHGIVRRIDGKQPTEKDALPKKDE